MLNLLNEIAKEPSTNEKIKIISKYKDNLLLADIFNLMYSSEWKYHVKKYVVSEVGKLNIKKDFELIKKLLIDLKQRAVTGHAALASIDNIMSLFDEESQEIFSRIIKHDARIGASTSLINKGFGYKVIKTTPYQRCSNYSQKRIDKLKWEEGVYVQKKEDGSFWYLTETGEFISRSGNNFNIGVGPSENVMVGELLVIDYNNNILPREIGNGIINSIYQDNSLSPLPTNYTLRYICWDALTPEEFKNLKSNAPYSERLKRNFRDTSLKLEVKFVRSHVVYSQEQADEIFEQNIASGQEGVVIKSPKSLWKDGTAADVIKRKGFFEVDLIATGFNEGTGKYEGQLGSIEFKSSDGLLVVNVSGYTDAQRINIWDKRDIYLNTIWAIKANAIIESKSKDVSSLFLPSIIEMRNDKTEADDINKIREVFNG